MSTILVVEDDVNTRLGLSEILTDEGYQVESAEDGYRALEALNVRVVDLLLSDLMLPDFSGFELHLKAKEVNPQIRTIIMTANDTTGVRFDAEERGVYSWLTKPLNINTLLESIKNAVACADMI